MSLRFGFLVALLVAVASATAVGSVWAQVLLNEMMADPLFDWDRSGVYSSRDDEWVEIINAGATPVALEGYRLAGADTTWRYGFTGVLNPGQVRLVFGGESYQWEQANGAPLYGLRLNNTGGTLLLMRTTEGAPVLVDSYTYLDLEAEDDRSSGRAPDGGPNWRLFDGMNPFTGSGLPASTGCAPSPGARLDCPTAASITSWGVIKSRFLGDPR